MNAVHGNPPSRIPTSRAYWELKAEQVMNRVFAPEPSIDLEIVETRPPSRSWLALSDRRLVLAAALSVLGLGLAGGSMVGWGLWMQHQQSLRQERNLLLLERLRGLTPDGMAAQTKPAADAPTANGAGPQLPPPPPDEPWMQELATLPASSAPPSRVLQVPVNNTISASAPPAQIRSNSDDASSHLPQLVGVVQSAGKPSTAIFQVDGGSTSASIGERIGGSGWLLKSAEGDSAVIEHGGTQRKVKIMAGF